MEKDEYAKFKADQDLIMARAELAKAYLSKLDKAEIADVSILAAITDWMETGDNSFFEEYCTFRFKKTAEEQKKELEALKMEIMEEEKHKDELKEHLKEMRAYDEEYQEYFDKMEDWRGKMANRIEEETPNCEDGTISKMMAFLERMFANNKNWKNKKLYVKIGNEIKPITNIEVAKGRILCAVAGGGVLLTEKPEAPENKSQRCYLNRRKGINEILRWD